MTELVPPIIESLTVLPNTDHQPSSDHASSTPNSFAEPHVVPVSSSSFTEQAAPTSLASSLKPTLPPISVGNQIITANPSSQYDIAGQTLVPGSPPITVSGTQISLAAAATALIIGSSTVVMTPAPTTGLPIIAVAGTAYTADTAGKYSLDNQILTPGGPAIIVSGTPILLPLSASVLVVGSSTVPLNPVSALVTDLPVLTIAGTAHTAGTGGVYTVGGQTLRPGGPAITVFGTPISIPQLAPALVIGTSTESLSAYPITGRPQITVAGTAYTANAAGDYLIGSQTLHAGAPAITVSGTPISLVPSASVLVIGTKTQTLTPVFTPKPASPLVTIAGTTYTANAAGAYVIGTQTLNPGGPAITVFGTPISLEPVASVVVVGTSTETLKPNPPPTAALPLITIAGSRYTANAAGDYIINGQTLIPGAPAITISGTPISLTPSASDLVIGTSTEILHPNPSAVILPSITIAGKTYTANAAGDYLIGSQTLIPGRSGIVVSGTPVSLAPDGKDALVGTSVETLVASTTGSPGIGGAILSAFNGGAGGTGTGAGMAFTGGSDALSNAYSLQWEFVVAAVVCIAGG